MKLKGADLNIARYADMLTAPGAEPRLRIMWLLLSAHPDGMVVGALALGPSRCLGGIYARAQALLWKAVPFHYLSATRQRAPRCRFRILDQTVGHRRSRSGGQRGCGGLGSMF